MGKLKRSVAALVLVLSVAGCLEAPTGLTRETAEAGPPGVKAYDAGGVSIRIGDAGGYCIADRQSGATPSGIRVVLAPCVRDEGPVRGLVLVNVLSSPSGAENLTTKELVGYFATAEGRRALSARGRPEDVEILDTRMRGQAFLVHARDAAGPVIPDTTADPWRMFLVVKGRLVIATLLNFADARMADVEMIAQLEAIAARLQALNG